ncbi:MAG: hypothetical protein ACRC6N_11060 [Plesiomonas sp.]|uniref:hypothetical protein n=1 Tax=Plesiomonas sp. TaxID=2486279 RepID=UPI003F2BAC09
MLNNEQQINAFKALNDDPIHLPASAITAKKTSENADGKSKEISDLIISEINYPITIKTEIDQLTKISMNLGSAAKSADELVDAITPYSAPAELATLNVGWDCYIKGFSLSEETPFYLVKAMADTALTTELNTVIENVLLDDVSAIMNDVNTTLATPALPPAGTPPPPKTLSPEQITALQVAVADLVMSTNPLQAISLSVSELAVQAVTSSLQAKSAFKNSVAISILSNISESSAINAAITAITPDSVISALRP